MQAVCTPEFFLFDPQFKLQYHGQFDAARPSNGVAVTGRLSVPAHSAFCCQRFRPLLTHCSTFTGSAAGRGV